MKRILLLLIFFIGNIGIGMAQDGIVGGTSLNALMRLQRGICQKSDDGVLIFIPIPPSKPGVPKTPEVPLVIGYDANTIYTFGQLGEYILYIIRDNETLYKTEVPVTEDIIKLPVELYDDCLLFFVSEKNEQCYYGEVRKGLLYDIHPDEREEYVLSFPYCVYDNTLLFNHVRIADGGILTIKGYLLCHSNTALTIENGGELIVDGGTLSNVRIIMDEGGRITLRNKGTIFMRSGITLDEGTVSIESGTIMSNQFGE